MKEKQLIRVNVTKTTPIKRQKVTYQWHWRRIITAVLVLLLIIVAIKTVFFSQQPTEEPIAPVSSSIESNSIEKAVVAKANTQANTQNEPADASPISPAEPKAELEIELDAELKADKTQLNEQTQPLAVNPTSPQSENTAQTANALNATTAPATHSVQPSEITASEAQPKSQSQPKSQPLPETPAPAKSITSDETQLASLSAGTKINTQVVSRAVLTTQIEQREPLNTLGSTVDVAEFDKKLLFFTELNSLQGQTVRHLWYFNNQLMAEVTLPVRTMRYRTYSSKNIMPTQLGTWHVELKNQDDQLLASKTFRLIDNQ